MHIQNPVTTPPTSARPTNLRTAWRALLLGTICTLSLAATAQTPANPLANATPCCGPITPAGQRLADALDASGVDRLWLAHRHVNWETGEADQPEGYTRAGTATHCSAFAAAMGKRLGVYMLRPPQHSPILLASAQTLWFDSADGVRQGWQPLADAKQAQSRANAGDLVVASFASPDPKKPGHIAIVRPSLKTMEALAAEGPQITQAGATNSLSTSTLQGFSHHRGAWPDGVRWFSHALASAPSTPAASTPAATSP